MQYSMIATCSEDLQDIVAEELRAIGATEIRQGFRAVHFCADESLYYACHLRLRTPSQILRELRNCSAESSTVLLSQAKRVRWNELFGLDKTYRIDAFQGDRGDDFPSSNDLSKTVRIAIETVFFEKTGNKPTVELKDPDVIVVIHVHRGRASISVCTSRMALHKRGYRHTHHPAPLKETTAAALLHLIGYDGSTPFLDPMSGSGTVVIEAAMIACHKSPLIHRKKGLFGFEDLKDFNKNLWREVCDAARDEKHPEPTNPIFASDLEARYVEDAKANALKARVERYIQFSALDFFEIKKPAETGILVANLPYGERMGEKENLEVFYKKIGDHLKQNFQGWRAGLLVNEESPYKFIGLKPTRRMPIKNGSIKTKFLIFDLYSGSHRKPQG